MATSKSNSPKINNLSVLDQLIWAVLGLMLTVVGTFVEAVVALPQFLTPQGEWQFPTDWHALGTYPLPVSLQVAAVLLVGCMGGQYPAMMSQIAYLGLGLAGFQIFSHGGGIGYWQEPTFGYLVGFIPAAGVCGLLAFRQAPRIEQLFLSCLAGLGIIHLCGLLYLVSLSLGNRLPLPLWPLIQQYSVYLLPGQMVIACLVALMARVLRFLLIY